jgi:glycosyltransferase involved in cell wall biosynthesis
LKITYFTHQYLPRHVGGSEVYTYGLAQRAQLAGHSVRVITHVETTSLDAKDYQAKHTEHAGIPVTELHHNLSRAGHPARAEYDNPYMVQLLKPELDANRPDVVHAIHSMKLSGAALRLCYELKVPVVLTLADYWFICPRHTLVRWNDQVCTGPAHDLDCVRCVNQLHGFANRRVPLPAPLLRLASKFNSRLLGDHQSHFWRDIEAIRERRQYLKEIVQRADRVIALSEFQKEMFVKNGYAPGKIEVLPHGLETGGLHPADGKQTHHATVVYIGSLVAHKGPDVLVKAISRVPELKVQLHIYGDTNGSTPYLTSLKELAARDDRVRLMGTFPMVEMGRVLATADVLALPALWYENEPLVLKAARYVGLPILASDIGTLSSFVRDGVNGRLLPPGNVNAWSQALAEFNPGRVAPDFSIKTMDQNARELFDIYEEVYSHRCAAANT